MVIPRSLILASLQFNYILYQAKAICIHPILKLNRKVCFEDLVKAESGHYKTMGGGEEPKKKFEPKTPVTVSQLPGL